jgi:hypothetical protein
MEVEYNSHTVPTSPIAYSQRSTAKTRFCRVLRSDGLAGASLVIPDQSTDIPSMTEGPSGHTQCRLVLRGKSIMQIQEYYGCALCTGKGVTLPVATTHQQGSLS